MRKRRSKDKILYDILRICSEGENYTRIIHRSYTNDAMVRYFIQLLIQNNMIEKIDGSPVTYKTTPKGEDLRERLKMHLDNLNGVFEEQKQE